MLSVISAAQVYIIYLQKITTREKEHVLSLFPVKIDKHDTDLIKL